MAKRVAWRSPEDLVGVGLDRARVLMMNEAHAGELRCVRTRLIGSRVLPTAHEKGVRYLAAEALSNRSFVERANTSRQLPDAGRGYLSQPEMRQLLQGALDLGWTLLGYEADVKWAMEHFGDLRGQEVTNWREEQQARNLIRLLDDLPGSAKLLVWCGNGHHSKIAGGDWRPMGYQFSKLSAIEAFAIDQIPTVQFPGRPPARWLTPEVVSELASMGGTAGFLTEEAPGFWGMRETADAFVFSIDNELE